ncbi:hypothetical protein B7P43_G15514 [Cryptotermes secundus]|uniref:Phorbol-ester/DAG-type domain-containing protein n=1 Tax=Cryptotermes secundus TaxID=105785 RepID=A0A2J7QX06_9NEOP|nr:hypothetical protein B7P43_G15514 [Cryptotermes secundus]
MASKDVCLLCDKPFYGKQKCIRCCVCELRFHCNCLKTNISECNVDAATGKSSFTCDNCVIGKEQSLVKNNTNKISSGLECSASTVGDNDSLSRQLEAVRLDGECTMEMVKSLMDMVTKLSCEVQVLKSDNTDLKIQLRDLRQFHTPLPSTSSEALSSTRDAATKTYSDVLTSEGGHPASAATSSGPSRQTSLPESSTIASDNQAADGFITVQRKRKLINNSDIWPIGCLIEKLKGKAIHSATCLLGLNQHNRSDGGGNLLDFKKNYMIQCMRCQQYGHSKSYCNTPFACVKCGGSHNTTECKKSRNTTAKCALCGGDHLANYKGCEHYQRLIADNNKPITQRTAATSTNTNIPHKNIQPIVHPQRPTNATEQYDTQHANRANQQKTNNKLLIYKTIIKPIWTYGIELWGCASRSNIEIIQRSQSKILRAIVDAPWYVSNQTLHTDLKIPYVRTVITDRIQKHYQKLESHPNNAIEALLQPTQYRRLRRTWPNDLQEN